MTQDEQWRPVVGYEGLYEVSDLGNVRSLSRQGRGGWIWGRVLKRYSRPDGRQMVTFYRDRRKSSVTIYPLVLEAFVGPRPEGMEGCHNNGDASDDRLENLRWDTRSENHRDAVRHGTHHEAKRTHCPKEHVLAAPNLVPASIREGKRQCLACNRAGAYARLALRRGQHIDRKALADEHYTRIMATC